MTTYSRPAALEGFHAFKERGPVGYSHPFRISDGFGKLPGTMAQALLNGPGVSLSFDGLKNQPATNGLRVVADENDGEARRVTLRNEADTLQLSLRYVFHAKHNAIVIEGEIENIGFAPIEKVTELRSFDLAFDCALSGDVNLHTLGGGTTHFAFPPYAFELDKRRILGSLWTAIRIDSGDTGRSSDDKMPFFYLEAQDGQSGVYGGLEWSGLWHLDFHRESEYLYIRGGIEELNLTLRPGEKIVMPRALLGFYEGSIDDGRNAMRRFIGDWFPLYQGEDLGAPVTWNHAWTFFNSINEEIFRAQVPVVAELGFEWMQIDWGWFELDDISGHGIMENIGNWEREALSRFPEGIKPMADLVREHGMKYCTWLDPEQAGAASDFAREHPQWMLYIDGEVMGMVNFGIRECQDWWIEFIGKLIEKWGIHKLKWDHNIDPRDYWRAHDDPNHRGLLQINHIRGVYRVWEEICRLHPALILENCSSGGRRFDLGTFARAHIQHGSDFNFHDDIIRNQISGCNCVMPTHRVIHTCTWGNHESPDIYVQSRFGGILRFSQDFASWPQPAIERMKKHIAVYKSVRHLLNQDFYAIFPQPRTQEVWDGWQYHDAESGEGFLMAFRMSGPDATQPIRLHGLDAAAHYELLDPYTDETQTMSGAALMNGEMSLTLEPNTAALRHYQRVKV